MSSELTIIGPGQILESACSPPNTRPAAGHTRVAVDYVSLCGSDRKLFSGTYRGPHSYPLRFGHEWAGRVLAAPPGAVLHEGDLVTGDCSRYCRHCKECDLDPNVCRHIEKFGITVDGFSKSVVDVETEYLYRVPVGVPSAVAAIAEPTAVAFRAVAPLVDRATQEGILVVGAGQIGLVAALLLKSLGVSQMAIADNDRLRLEIAKEVLGQVQTVVPQEIQPVISYREIAGQAEYPCVLDATGTTTGLTYSLVKAACHGTVMTVGMLGNSAAPLTLITAKALRLRGSIGGTGAFPQVLNILQDQHATFSRLITEQYPATRWQDAFCDQPGRVKTQLVFGANNA